MKRKKSRGSEGIWGKLKRELRQAGEQYPPVLPAPAFHRATVEGKRQTGLGQPAKGRRKLKRRGRGTRGKDGRQITRGANGEKAGKGLTSLKKPTCIHVECPDDGFKNKRKEGKRINQRRRGGGWAWEAELSGRVILRREFNVVGFSKEGTGGKGKNQGGERGGFKRHLVRASGGEVLERLYITTKVSGQGKNSLHI